MEYEEYAARAGQAAQLVEAGHPEAALPVFTGLAGDASLPDVDRATMWHNAAIAASRAGLPDDEVERCWRAGVDLERPWMRDVARLELARWLAGRGRAAEAAGLYRELLGEGWLNLQQRLQLSRALDGLEAAGPPAQ